VDGTAVRLVLLVLLGWLVPDGRRPGRSGGFE